MQIVWAINWFDPHEQHSHSSCVAIGWNPHTSCCLVWSLLASLSHTTHLAPQRHFHLAGEGLLGGVGAAAGAEEVDADADAGAWSSLVFLAGVGGFLLGGCCGRVLNFWSSRLLITDMTVANGTLRKPPKAGCLDTQKSSTPSGFYHTNNLDWKKWQSSHRFVTVSEVFQHFGNIFAPFRKKNDAFWDCLLHLQINEVEHQFSHILSGQVAKK